MKRTFILVVLTFFISLSCYAENLTVWVSWEGEELYNSIADEFETETGNSVEILFVPKMSKKLFPGVKSGNLPDICLIKDTYTGGISVSDKTVVIDEESLKKIGNFTKRDLEAFSERGNLLALPYYADTQLALINLDFFKKAGVESPSKTYSFDDLKNLKGLADTDGEIIAWDFMSPYIFYSFARHFSELVDKKGKPNFNNSEMKEALGTIKNYFDIGLAKRYERGALISKFEKGETGIILQGSYLIKEFKENGMNLDISGFPTIDDKAVSPVVDSKGFAIFNSEKLDLALEFIAFINSKSIGFCEEYFKLPLWTQKYPHSLEELAGIIEAGDYMIEDDRFQDIYESVMKPVLQSVYAGEGIEETLVNSQNYVEENW